MLDSFKEFNKKGFPIIRFHDDYFEVKAIDYWEFRSFKYVEVTEIDYYHNKYKWWNNFSITYFAFSSNEPHKFKVKKENGADWIYDAPRKYSKEFAEVVKELLKRCNLERLK